MSQKKRSKFIEEPQMVTVSARPFVMVTSSDQVALLARRDELAMKWQEKGCFNIEKVFWLPALLREQAVEK